MGSGTSLEYCDLTDIGRRRASNQDARAVLAPWNAEQFRRRGWLLLVADGMGAHAAGEMASAIAAEQVPLAYEKHANRSPPLALKTSLQHANTEIHTRGEGSADLKGMGTTCTALVIVPRGALVGHVGDSRAYRVRGSTIEQLSRDHSLAWDVEAARAKGGGEPIPSPPKNIITRSMGPHGRLEVDLEGPFPVQQDDIYILCSDGLSGQVADEEIGGFAAALPPDEAAAALLGLALVRGAPDNVTLIVAKAGAKEVTSGSATADPWNLSEENSPSPQQQPLPWKPLAFSAACLLGALLFNPWTGLTSKEGLLGGTLGVDLGDFVSWSVSALMVLLTVVGLVTSLLIFLNPGGPERRVLPAGARLGKGPYRTYDCTPTAKLVEGIAASVESAADGLSDAERKRAIDYVVEARRKVTTGDFPAAFREAARAIGVYRESVEAARRDDTIRTSDS